MIKRKNKYTTAQIINERENYNRYYALKKYTDPIVNVSDTITIGDQAIAIRDKFDRFQNIQLVANDQVDAEIIIRGLKQLSAERKYFVLNQENLFANIPANVNFDKEVGIRLRGICRELNTMDNWEYPVLIIKNITAFEKQIHNFKRLEDLMFSFPQVCFLYIDTKQNYDRCWITKRHRIRVNMPIRQEIDQIVYEETTFRGIFEQIWLKHKFYSTFYRAIRLNDHEHLRKKAYIYLDKAIEIAEKENKNLNKITVDELLSK